MRVYIHPIPLGHPTTLVSLPGEMGPRAWELASGMWVASKCGKDLGMAGVKDSPGNFAANERKLWHEFKSRCAEWEP